MKKISSELATLAERIKQQTQSVKKSFYEIGRDLIKAKELCQHGDWLAFLGQADIQARTAQRLMQYVNALPANVDLKFLPSVSEIIGRTDNDIEITPAVREAVDHALMDSKISVALKSVIKWLDDPSGFEDIPETCQAAMSKLLMDISACAERIEAQARADKLLIAQRLRQVRIGKKEKEYLLRCAVREYYSHITDALGEMSEAMDAFKCELEQTNTTSCRI